MEVRRERREGRGRLDPARAVAAGLVAVALLAAGCTQESQNRFGRALQNWTGTNGVLDVYAGERLVMRFISIDKLTTSLGTGSGGGEARSYRFGYGIFDENQNWVADAGEKKLYFEVSDYSTNYVFYENPRP